MKNTQTTLARWFHQNGYEPIAPLDFYIAIFPSGELATYTDKPRALEKLLLTFNFKDGTRTITLKDAQSITSENSSDIKMVEVPLRKPLKCLIFKGFSGFLFIFGHFASDRFGH